MEKKLPLPRFYYHVNGGRKSRGLKGGGEEKRGRERGRRARKLCMFQHLEKKERGRKEGSRASMTTRPNLFSVSALPPFSLPFSLISASRCRYLELQWPDEGAYFVPNLCVTKKRPYGNTGPQPLEKGGLQRARSLAQWSGGPNDPASKENQEG